jgi:hypothetical protein
MEGQDVVTSDDHKIGTVVGERKGYAIVEMGHVFKTKHAIPVEFLHEHEGVQRATVGREVVAESPKLDGDELDEQEIRLHYGLVEVTLDDPDPIPLDMDRDPHRNPDEPAFDRTTNSADPAWTTAGLSDRDPQRDDAVHRDRHLGDP